MPLLLAQLPRRNRASATTSSVSLLASDKNGLRMSFGGLLGLLDVDGARGDVDCHDLTDLFAPLADLIFSPDVCFLFLERIAISRNLPWTPSRSTKRKPDKADLSSKRSSSVRSFKRKYSHQSALDSRRCQSRRFANNQRAASSSLRCAGSAETPLFNASASAAVCRWRSSMASGGAPSDIGGRGMRCPLAPGPAVRAQASCARIESKNNRQRCRERSYF